MRFSRSRILDGLEGQVAVAANLRYMSRRGLAVSSQ